MWITPEQYAARSRGDLANGVIDQEVVDALLDDDLVIAVLTFQNPQVFYETALAQAAARPLILMVEEGRELAFDARSAHAATYRLDTDSVVSGVNVAHLHAIVGEIAEKGPPAWDGGAGRGVRKQRHCLRTIAAILL